MTEATSSPSYTLGWNDGYAEGYACKLVDVTEPFMPAGDAADIEAGADYVAQKYAATFPDRASAIGVVRGILMAIKGQEEKVDA